MGTHSHCSKCGARLDPGASFCGNCGAPVGNDEAPKGKEKGTGHRHFSWMHTARGQRILFAAAIVVVALCASSIGYAMHTSMDVAEAHAAMQDRDGDAQLESSSIQRQSQSPTGEAEQSGDAQNGDGGQKGSDSNASAAFGTKSGTDETSKDTSGGVANGSADSQTSDDASDDASNAEVRSSLKTYYDDLASYDSLITSAADAFNNNYTNDDKSIRMGYLQNVQSLNSEIEGELRELYQLSVPKSSAYHEDYERILRCYSDCTSRLKCLAQGWQVSLAFDNPASHSSEILKPIQDARDGSGINAAHHDFQQTYPLINLD